MKEKKKNTKEKEKWQSSFSINPKMKKSKRGKQAKSISSFVCLTKGLQVATAALVNLYFPFIAG